MSKYDETIIHESDGIQEMDNKLPRWWVLLFYITIVFSVIYMVYFHLLDLGMGQEEKYDEEMRVAREARDAMEAATPYDPTTPSNVPFMLAQGRATYGVKCQSCHAEAGAGKGAYPNLTDAYWINGPTFADTVDVITQGSPNNPAMVAFSKELSPREIHYVASYIYSLRGSNVGIEPQPDIDKEFPGSDSTDYHVKSAKEPSDNADNSDAAPTS